MTDQTPQMRIAELNRRLLNKETVTDEEIIEGINLLRSDRAARTATKAKKVADTQAQAAKGEDLLDNL